MKILEIVKVNNRFSFVVDEAAPLIYHEEFVFDQAFKRTEHMLIGESADGRMDFLVHHNYGSMKAFAGRELHIQMEDGTQRTIKDVWWSEGSSAWATEHDVELRGFSYGTLDGMIDCCVFYASIMRAERLQELINEFYETHPDYTPWDYDAWHDHCQVLHEAQHQICTACHTSFHDTKVPDGICPKCSGKLITLGEYYGLRKANTRKGKKQ